jgi:hypothetical protein
LALDIPAPITQQLVARGGKRRVSAIWYPVTTAKDAKDAAMPTAV